MADEQFLNSEQELQREQFRSRDNETPQMQQMMQGQTANANGIPCPKCGTVNDPDATYCLSFDPDVAAPGRDSIRLGRKPNLSFLTPDDSRRDKSAAAVTQPQRSEDGLLQQQTCPLATAATQPQRSENGLCPPACEAQSGQNAFTRTGRELSEGLTLTLPVKRSSLLLRYRRCQGEPEIQR